MKHFYLISLFLLTLGCSQEPAGVLDTPPETSLYSKDGREFQVSFEALYRSKLRHIRDLQPPYVKNEIHEVTQFLFGPLTHRDLGGVQKGQEVELLLDKAYLENGRVMIPYKYSAVWMIDTDAVDRQLQLPLPYSIRDLLTKDWKNCTDSSDSEHSEWSFFWYFWDPSRRGCDHVLGKEFQEITVTLGEETAPTRASYPEYQKLIRNIDGQQVLEMTFAFGYVDDLKARDPFKDSDYGMYEFREFYESAKGQLRQLGFKEAPLRQSDITKKGSRIVGSKFTGRKDGVIVEVSILAASGIDQMDIFADSYARKHHGFFSWFGHSRVGGGFDADRFRQTLHFYPNEFSLSPDYQLIYWAGCNSYSYYTLPFFAQKAELNPGLDPNGTKNLDIISNALPSLFAFNAFNAGVLFEALINWQDPTSYQDLVDKLEGHAKARGYPVLVNVLGDEDN